MLSCELCRTGGGNPVLHVERAVVQTFREVLSPSPERVEAVCVSKASCSNLEFINKEQFRLQFSA